MQDFFFLYFIKVPQIGQGEDVFRLIDHCCFYDTYNVRQFKPWIRIEGFLLRVGVDGTKQSMANGAVFAGFVRGSAVDKF